MRVGTQPRHLFEDGTPSAWRGCLRHTPPTHPPTCLASSSRAASMQYGQVLLTNSAHGTLHSTGPTGSHTTREGLAAWM